MPGARIKKRREALGLTQEDMSLQLHMSQSAYSRIENKEGDLRVDTAKEIARILGCNLADLLPDDVLLEQHAVPHHTSAQYHPAELVKLVDAVVEEKINHLKMWMEQRLGNAVYK
jgi:transcriptional regulator with XRE-family HTH domain